MDIRFCTRNHPDATRFPEMVYSHLPLLSRPGDLLRRMLKDLAASRPLAWRLLVRNLTSQYRQSVFGCLWILFGPLVTTAGFVFLNMHGILRAGDTGSPYVLYVFVGTLLWQVFTDALHRPLRWFSTFKSTLSRVNFPHEAIVWAAFGEVFTHFAIRFALLHVCLLAYGTSVTFSSVIAVPVVLVLITLGLTVGVLLVPAGLLLGDVERSLYPLTMLWFVATPVIYPPPVTWPASLINQFNPVSPLLITARELLLGGTLTHMGSLLLVLGLTILGAFASWILLRLAMPHLVVRING
jgi:lipopolysaccharide transport system permease protein